MKKAFTIFLAALFLAVPLANTFAEEIGIFAALQNFADVKDYKALQAIYGHMEFDDAYDHISVAYRVNVNSAIEDTDAAQDSFSRINLYAKFFNHNEVSEATPFREMVVQAAGEVTAIGQHDLYFRLSDVSISIQEPGPYALEDVDSFLAEIEPYKGTWYHVSTSDFVNQELGSDVDVDTQVEAFQNLQDAMGQDPEEAILDYAETTLSDPSNGFSEEELGKIITGLGMFLEAKLFNVRDVITGNNTGFKFFSLNRAAIMDLIQDFANQIGEELTADDLLEIREALGKFSLSGIYRIQDGLLDNLLLRFKLREIDDFLELELNYRFKLWDVNESNNIKAPGSFEELF